MSEEVSWLVKLVIKPGQLDNFRALTGEMVESSRREAGVLSYERFVSEDGKFVLRLRAVCGLGRSADPLANIREDVQPPLPRHGGPAAVHGVWRPDG